MSMATDDERREVARRLRERAGKRVLNLGELLWCIGCDDGDDAAAWNRLADLIEPTDGFDLDTVQRVCFECMEGCDEPEWTLYTTIHDAIARYKRGESGPTYDRDALLVLADEIERTAGFDTGIDPRVLLSFARRIREACGETQDD